VSFGPFTSPNPYTAGALDGTATSLLIPANTLTNYNTSYNAGIAFFRYTSGSNSAAVYLEFAYLESGTQFTVNTINTNIVSSPFSLSDPLLADGFSFTVNSAANQTFTIECTSNLNSTAWQMFVTTNSASGTLRIRDPRINTNNSFYYRAVSGP